MNKSLIWGVAALMALSACAAGIAVRSLPDDQPEPEEKFLYSEATIAGVRTCYKYKPKHPLKSIPCSELPNG